MAQAPRPGPGCPGGRVQHRGAALRAGRHREAQAHHLLLRETMRRLLLLPLALLACAGTARADEGPGEFLNEYNVYSPYVVEGQSEVEFRLAQYRDSSMVVDQDRGTVLSFA